MTATTTIQRLNKICASQSERGFILTGFFLDPGELSLLRDLLAVDDPNVGAVGRYKGVPVFSKTTIGEVDVLESEGSIDYTFVRMGVLDMGAPVDV